MEVVCPAGGRQDCRGDFSGSGGVFSTSFQLVKYLEVSRGDGGLYSVELLCVSQTPFSNPGI